MVRFLNKTNAINNKYDGVIMDVRQPTIVVFIPGIFVYIMHVSESKEKLEADENTRSYRGKVNISIGNVIKLRLENINSMLELKFRLIN